MKTRSLIASVIALQCALAGANAPQGSRCSFESQLAPDEQSLLDGVKTALTPMSNNPACQAQVAQIRTFEAALTAYNQQNSAAGSGGISCMNYESVWNSRFDDFANNWSAPAGANDSFSSCRGRSSREEAIECAALVTSTQKSQKRTSCESQRDTITTTASESLRTQTFQTGITALNDVLLNQECMTSAGESRLNLIQNAVGLASQAATISLLGTGVGLLVGGAAQLVNAAIGSIFRNPTRQAMAILDNRENFSRIACLYEQVETKALRCERISAGRQLDVLQNMFDASAQFCEENKDVLSQNDLMTTIDQVISGLTPQAPAAGGAAPTPQELTQETFDSIVEQLSGSFPGTDVTKLQVAEHSALFVSRQLGMALRTDESLTAHLEAQGETDLSRIQLRRRHREVTEEKERADSVLAVIRAVRVADARGTQMSEEDLARVQETLREFNAGETSFSGAFNEVMRNRASFGDNLGDKIAAYNSRLTEAQIHRSSNELAQSLRRVSTSSFEDGGRFQEARNAITPHLRRTLNRELDTLIDRVKSLSGIQPGTPDSALAETLRTQEESVIYPLLRVCNQLRTVMDSSRASDTNASSRAQPSVCQAFNCANGMKTFEDYLERNGVSGIDPRRCDVNCRSHYDRYICEERSSLPTIRGKIKAEFLNNGTICGKSMREAFRRADGI